MSPGALYRYFPSKNAIIRALVEADVAETHSLLKALGEADDFAAAMAKALRQTMIDVSDQDYGRLALEIAAEAGRNPEVAELLRTSGVTVRLGKKSTRKQPQRCC